MITGGLTTSGAKFLAVGLTHEEVRDLTVNEALYAPVKLGDYGDAGQGIDEIRIHVGKDQDSLYLMLVGMGVVHPDHTVTDLDW